MNPVRKSKREIIKTGIWKAGKFVPTIVGCS
jgi:hypothetical protein